MSAGNGAGPVLAIPMQVAGDELWQGPEEWQHPLAVVDDPTVALSRLSRGEVVFVVSEGERPEIVKRKLIAYGIKVS